jgi:hypothetical protein
MPNETQRSCTGFEFTAGSVFGIRQWAVMSLDLDDAVLFGNNDVPWVGRAMTASCVGGRLRKPHTAPEERCTCGIYGWYAPTAFPQPYSGSVVGVIEGTGRTLMGSKGFRCEHARIMAFTVIASPREQWGCLRDRYPGVPVFDSTDKMLAEFPLTEPPEGTEPESEPDAGRALPYPGLWQLQVSNSANSGYPRSGVVWSRTQGLHNTISNSSVFSIGRQVGCLAAKYAQPDRAVSWQVDLGPGRVRIAPLGSPTPANRVENDRFFDSWPLDWTDIGPMPIVTLTDAPNPNPAGGDAVSMMFGWESADHTQRAMATRAVVEVNSGIVYVQRASGNTPTYTLYSAGLSTP